MVGPIMRRIRAALNRRRVPTPLAIWSTLLFRGFLRENTETGGNPLKAPSTAVLEELRRTSQLDAARRLGLYRGGEEVIVVQEEVIVVQEEPIA